MSLKRAVFAAIGLALSTACTALEMDDESGAESGGSPAAGGNPSTGGTSTGGTMASTGGNPGSSTGGAMASCEDGPLDAPIPNCEPLPAPDTGDYHADCVARINQLRWECQCLPPLERWTEGEACANEQAQYDYEEDRAHAGFSDRICDGGFGQNECPGYGPRFSVIEVCLQQMWDEGPGQDFQTHGHYINMTNPDHTRVACGTYTTPEGEIWAVQNFDR